MLDQLLCASWPQTYRLQLENHETLCFHAQALRSALASCKLHFVVSCSSRLAKRTERQLLEQGCGAPCFCTDKAPHTLSAYLQVDEKDNILVEAFDCLTAALCEYDNLTKLSRAAAAGIQFGAAQEGALAKLHALHERLEFMHEVRPFFKGGCGTMPALRGPLHVAQWAGP